MEGEILDSKKIGMIRTVHRSSESILDLMDSLLDLSAIEAGKLILHCARTNLNRLLEQNVSHNRILADREEIQITFIDNADFPELLLDGAKINQVLNNLIGNAIKVSNPG